MNFACAFDIPNFFLSTLKLVGAYIVTGYNLTFVQNSQSVNLVWTERCYFSQSI